MVTLKASHADTWMKCPQMPKLSATVPRGTMSDAAREGICAAWVADEVLKGRVGSCAELLDKPCPEGGWLADAEIIHHVQRYVDLIVSKGGYGHAEQRLDLTANIRGVSDWYCYYVEDGFGVLDITDLKYGYRIVEPDTWQLVIYGCAAYRHLVETHGVVIDKVRLGIYQPRAYHPSGPYRFVEHRSADLMDLWRHVLSIEQQVLSPTAGCVTGDHCRLCPAVGICTAATHRTYDLYEEMVHTDSRPLDNGELSRELTALTLFEGLVKGRKSAVEAEIIARIEQGQTVNGWVRQVSLGHKRWIAKREVIEMMTGMDPSSDSMVTPAELIRRGADPEVVDMLTERPTTRPTLKPFSTKNVKAVFGE